MDSSVTTNDMCVLRALVILGAGVVVAPKIREEDNYNTVDMHTLYNRNVGPFTYLRQVVGCS